MTEHRLPVQQLVILSICRFAEPIALTSVYPYIPEMLESFGVPENDIARWAGIASAIFSICQAFTAFAWGAASDRYGRKPIILLGLFNTMWSMMLWGFSTNLTMAIAARALQGLGNGNVGILRTTVAELCPWKELQPRAFSIMPLVYTIGAIFGPSFGGALANPLHVDPRTSRGSGFLEHFPYILPNLVAATFFTIGIIVGWLYLKESLESKRNYKDLGLQTGEKLIAFVRRTLGLNKHKDNIDNEREPLLVHQKTDLVRPSNTPNDMIKLQAPRIRDVLTYQTTLNLVVYTLLATYTLAYDQLLPVFMHHPPQLRSPKEPFLKFSGGFGLDSQRIGAIFTFFAISSTIWQFLLFPPMARWLGVLTCLRIAFMIFPVVFFVTPFLSLIQDHDTRQYAMIGLLMVRGIGGTFGFPTSTIMLTNSASSLRVLGTINGFATSVSAVGRAFGPFLSGGLFTWGVKRGYLIVPFWTLSVISFLAFIPTLWLVEGDGFGNDDTEDVETPSTEVSAHGEDVPEAMDVAAASESEFGGFDDEPSNTLSYTRSHSSAALASEDEYDSDGAIVERRRSSDALSSTRSHSQGRRKPTVKRRSSVPIGMGKGFRRLSSNLGSTGVGAPGTSWGGT